MTEQEQVIAKLEVIAEVLKEGLDDLKAEVRKVTGAHENRIDHLESKLDRMDGGVSILRLLVTASFLGTVFVVATNHIF